MGSNVNEATYYPMEDEWVIYVGETIRQDVS